MDPTGARIRSGDYSDLVDPLDYHVLGMLPDFDSNLGGMYQIGETSARVCERINEKAGAEVLSPATAAIRIRILAMGGLAREVRMVGSRGKRSYQKTKQGEEVYATWFKQQA